MEQVAWSRNNNKSEVFEKLPVHPQHSTWAELPKKKLSSSSKSQQTPKMSTTTKTGSVECGICSKTLSSKSSLTRHSLLHSAGTEVPRNRCEFCSKQFHQKCDLVRHLTRHTGTKDFVCPICDERFNTQKNLKYHVEKHSSLNRYDCEKCGKTFVGQKLLKSHQAIHVSSEIWPCTSCGASFRTRGYLRNHMRRHSNDFRFVCEFEGCDKKFKYRSSFRSHQRKRHGENCDELATEWETQQKKKQLLIFDYPIKLNGRKVEIEINNDVDDDTKFWVHRTAGGRCCDWKKKTSGKFNEKKQSEIAVLFCITTKLNDSKRETK